MKFRFTREWLQKKLAEMDAAGTDEACEVGFSLDTDIGSIMAKAKGLVVVAKMRCTSVNRTGSETHPNTNVQLGAVFSNDPMSENRAFAQATPSASVSMNIDPGRPAATAFEHGGEFLVYFVPLGIPEFKYIKDGMPPVSCEVVVTKRDGSDPLRASWDVTSNKVTVRDYFLEGSDLCENVYAGTELYNAGYTHWRMPRKSE